MFEIIMMLILTIAADVGVPPYFALAIAIQENIKLDPMLISPINKDGSVDRGIMQLNSRYFDVEWQDPAINIRTGCLLIKELMGKRLELRTYWAVACAYNCGYTRFVTEGPPEATIDYAGRVMNWWLNLQGLSYINPLISEKN